MKNFDRDSAALRIARIVADLLDNMANKNLIVNLGVGIPTLVANFLNNPRVFFHAENGMVGVGPAPLPDDADPDLIDAGRQPVTETPGCCFFDSADSFAIIRGGHMDATVIGAFEVDSEGHIANWTIPGGDKLGVGGAMDLVCGAKKVFVAMTHSGKNGPKLVKKCSLPLTGNRCVDYVVTEYGAFNFSNGCFTLIAVPTDVVIDELVSITGFEFEVSPQLKYISL